MGIVRGADAPLPPIEKPGWKLTFHDEFDRPQLNDIYWFSAYRSGRKEYFKRIGHESRWVDHNAHYLIEGGILKLRIDEKLPFRPDKSTPCVSCIQTSDHRFGATTDEYQILDKFAQKYGWFEIRAKCAKGSGLLNAFWLHQHDPTKQEYTPEGRKKKVGDGVVEIDIIEQQGQRIGDASSAVDLNVHFTNKAHYRPRSILTPPGIPRLGDGVAGGAGGLVSRRQGHRNLQRPHTAGEDVHPDGALQYSGWIGISIRT